MLDAAIRVGLIALILLGGVILTPMALHAVQSGNPSQQAQSANQTDDKAGEAEAPTPAPFDGGVNEFGQPPAADPRQAAQDEREESDLQAQRNMAFAAFLSVGVGCLGEIRVPLSGLQTPLASPIYLEGFVEYQSRNGAPFFFTPFVWVLKFARDGGKDGPPAAERIDVSYFSPPPT